MVNKAPSASLFSSILLLILAFLFAMADSAPKSVASSSESAVHIVYTERPLENEEPEAYHIRTLASILGRSVCFLSLLFVSRENQKENESNEHGCVNLCVCVCVCFLFCFVFFYNYFNLLVIVNFCCIHTVRRLRRGLWYTVTRRLPVDSPLSSLLNRSRKFQVSPLSLSLRRNYLNMLVRVLWFFLGFMMTILPIIGKCYLFIWSLSNIQTWLMWIFFFW